MADPTPEAESTPTDSTETGAQPAPDPVIRIGLIVVAVCCVLAAVGHAIWPDRIDQATGIFLGLAAVTLIIREVQRFKSPWVEWELVQQLKQKVNQVDKKVSVIEDRGGLPGRVEPGPRATAPRLPATDRQVGETGGAEHEWESDPNKGRFGGSPTANHRALKAKITPAAGPDSAACEVRVWVESTDPVNHPLTGAVTFHLHPTFGDRAKVTVPVGGGVARDKFTSWGAFTVGAETDEGQTRLELDLMNVAGGTEKFYAS
jgi:hypothetical protein